MSPALLSPQPPTSRRLATKPSSLACTACRGKHLKCDGRQPICTRCETLGGTCAFSASRRGLRPQRIHAPVTGIRPTTPRHRGTADSLSHTGSDWRDLEDQSNPAATPQVSRDSHRAPPEAGSRVGNEAAVGDHLIDHYYTSFHSSHALVPERGIQSHRRSHARLDAVLQLVGSHYCSAASVSAWQDVTRSCFESRCMQDSVHDVQALLLHSMSSMINNDTSAAQASLHQAISLALRLRLERAETHTRTMTLSKESSVSLWWQLVEIDALCAAMSGRIAMLGVDLDQSMPLPSSTSTRAMDTTSDDSTGHHSFTLGDLDFRPFDDADSSHLSSAVSRVEAVLLLRRILTAAANTNADPEVIRSLDYQLTAWTHHLPSDRREVINTCGQTDYTLFQARTIINVSSIILHFPRSNLVHRNPVASTSGLACARNNSVPVFPYGVHAVNAINASKAICDLASLRLPLQNLSPFFVCALSLAAMVQLAAARSHREARCSELYKSRISLLLGVLKSTGEFFDIARRTEQQLRPLARHIFSERSTSDALQACGQQSEALDLSMFLVDDMWAWNRFNLPDLPAMDIDVFTPN